MVSKLFADGSAETRVSPMTPLPHISRCLYVQKLDISNLSALWGSFYSFCECPKLCPLSTIEHHGLDIVLSGCDIPQMLAILRKILHPGNVEFCFHADDSFLKCIVGSSEVDPERKQADWFPCESRIERGP